MKNVTVMTGLALLMTAAACENQARDRRTGAEQTEQGTQRQGVEPSRHEQGAEPPDAPTPGSERTPMGGPEFEAQGPGETPRRPDPSVGERDPMGMQRTQFTIDIDPQIVQRCQGMSDAQIQFETDTTKLPQEARDRLNDLSRCLSEGPLAREKVAIVGYAESSGAADFNYELAGNRAEAVLSFLGQQGVPSDRMQPLSMPPSAASAQPTERRVAVRLADNVMEDIPSPTDQGQSPGEAGQAPGAGSPGQGQTPGTAPGPGQTPGAGSSPPGSPPPGGEPEGA